MKLKVAVALTAMVVAIGAAAGVGSKSGSGKSDFGLATESRISPFEIMIKIGTSLPVDEVKDPI
jgi:hypothetical protein